MPELAFVLGRVPKDNDQVDIVELPLTDWLGLPLLDGLRTEAEHPASKPHRDPLGGQVTDLRELHFGGANLAR